MASLTTKPCSQCGALHNRDAQRYCASCHAKYMREWRKTHRLQGIAREKDIARSIAGVYKRRGLLAVQPCEVCGLMEAEMHHHDYSNPLGVRWICRPHHLELRYYGASATIPWNCTETINFCGLS